MRITPALFALVLVGSVAACGDDGDQLTKAEYIAAADELCAEADETLDEMGDPESIDDLVEQLEAGKEVYEQLAADIDALEDPDEGEEQADEIFDLLDDIIDELDEVIEVAETEDPVAIQEAIEEIEEISEEADELARDFGFEECGVDDEEDTDDESEEDASGSGDEDFAPVNEPTQEDIDAVLPLFQEGSGDVFTDEEATCIVRYLLERVELTGFADLPEELTQEAAVECLTTARLLEIGQAEN